MASNKGKSSKKVVDFSKSEKKAKDTLLLDASLYELADGLVDGKEFIEEVRRFGKVYYKVKNVVSSL